ncbi:MAG: histidinol dehydrogenase [Clostridiales bacterium]|nr:histidinol dehydrogenase [Clostridiales bacterium]
MKTLKFSKERTEADITQLRKTVSDIIGNIIKNGDEALISYNEQFDKCDRSMIKVTADEIAEAYRNVSQNDVEDMKRAAANIRYFSEAQRATLKPLENVSPEEGIMLGHRIIPVDSCCCYVPGGGYPLYSTALMLAIPAKVAGVERVAACSPMMKGTNKIHPKTLVAMDIAGVDEIYAVGGAQAIAAFSYGTEQIKDVSLIVGPGNSFVAEAKRQCYGKIGIDFVAGPSEVLIIADGTADPEIIAADILAQSEHDKEAKGLLVTIDKAIGEKVIAAVEKQLELLETKEKAGESWGNYGEVLLADSLDEAIAFANAYAPEHMEVNVREEDIEYVSGKLRNYGSLFIGENTAEVFGDYASGTNHTLPTMGAAKYTGGVWVGSFLKTCTYQYMSVSAMKNIAPLVSTLARGEGLIAHARAAEIRKEKNNDK